MLTPAFVGVFGEPGDEGSADADAILHAANRLMDYHEPLQPTNGLPKQQIVFSAGCRSRGSHFLARRSVRKRCNAAGWPTRVAGLCRLEPTP
jgi:hypothetical protein